MRGARAQRDEPPDVALLGGAEPGEDPEARRRDGQALGSPSYNLYRPAALIIPSNETGLIKTWDNACALENIFLAAHSMGIASVWINQGSDTCNDPGVRAVLTELGVPEDHMVYGMAALGYAAAEPKDVEKKYPVTIIE